MLVRSFEVGLKPSTATVSVEGFFWACGSGCLGFKTSPQVFIYIYIYTFLRYMLPALRHTGLSMNLCMQRRWHVCIYVRELEQDTVWSPTTAGDPRSATTRSVRRGRLQGGARPGSRDSSTVSSKSIMLKALFKGFLWGTCNDANMQRGTTVRYQITGHKYGIPSVMIWGTIHALGLIPWTHHGKWKIECITWSHFLL